MTKFSLDEYVTAPEELNEPEMIALFGPHGGGKTYLAASASEVEGLYPILYIDTEGSTHGTITGFPKGRIDVLEPQKRWPGNEYAGTIAALEGLLDPENEHKYKTVVIDTADVLAEWAIADGYDPKDGFAKWNFVHSELTAPPYQRNDDWDDEASDRGLFHRLKNAPFLVILVIHDKQETNAEGVVTMNTFQWSGQGKTKLGGIPDMVGYVTRDTKSTGVSTTTVSASSSKRFKTKNRFDLPFKMEDVRMTDLYEHIRARGVESEEN